MSLVIEAGRDAPQSIEFTTASAAIDHVLKQSDGIAYLQYPEPEKLIATLPGDYKVIPAVYLSGDDWRERLHNKDAEKIVVVGGPEVVINEGEKHALYQRKIEAISRYQQIAEAIFYKQAVRDGVSLLYIARGLPSGEVFGTYIHEPTGETSSFPWSHVPHMERKVWTMKSLEEGRISVRRYVYRQDEIKGKNNYTDANEYARTGYANLLSGENIK